MNNEHVENETKELILLKIDNKYFNKSIVEMKISFIFAPHYKIMPLKMVW